MMRRLSGGIAFIFAFVLGFGYFIHTFRYQQKRSTASFKNNYDLSCLSGEDLKKAIANRIVLGFKGIRKDGYMGLSVGHYTYSDSDEDKKMMCADRNISSTFTLVTKKMACEIYPTLHLQFVADGESSNGDKREMEVDAPCTVSGDLSRTDVTWVPWKQLSQETPFEGVSDYTKPSKVTVKTHNISDKWPSKWLLNRIQLEGSDGMITVDSAQIREVAGRPIIIEFN